MPSKRNSKKDIERIKRINKYANQVDSVYRKAINEAVRIAQTTEIDHEKPFKFKNYPAIKSRAKQIFRDYALQLNLVISSGIREEWQMANLANDELVSSVLNVSKLPKDIASKYMNRNIEALNVFQNRKLGDGLDISERIWQYKDKFRNELEMSLDIGIGEGKGSVEMAQDIQQYLKQPDKLFRRVRDKWGSLQLSMPAKDYHPGQGVYRSSYKNAHRLARSEPNMAYLESDHLRYQQLDFVVGFEVVPSSAHKIFDICDDLKGKYPKEFKFIGWHTQCMCHVISILQTKEEFNKAELMLLNGKDFNSIQSVNTVKDVPEGFSRWVSENNERAKGWKSEPYFMRDNPVYIKNASSQVFIDRSRTFSSELSEVSKRIAEKLGVGLSNINIKSTKRILEKANMDYGGDVRAVKDMVRNTFVSDESKHELIISEIKKNFEVVRVLKRTAEKDPLGYSGYLLNVKSKEGILGEIQVNTPQMIYAKEKKSDAIAIIGKDVFKRIKKSSGLNSGMGHFYYEKHRVLNALKDIEEIKNIVLKSKEYYSEIRNIKL